MIFQKCIMLLIILFFTTPCVSTVDYFNTSYYYYEQDFTYLAGENVITPHYHFNDNYFSLYNDGQVSYQVYMYDYIGLVSNDVGGYKNAFIGIIEPDQMIMLTTNASYYVYADYKDVKDLQSVEIVKERFNQWWVIILVGIILIIGTIRIGKVVVR